MTFPGAYPVHSAKSSRLLLLRLDFRGNPAQRARYEFDRLAMLRMPEFRSCSSRRRASSMDGLPSDVLAGENERWRV